MHHPHDGVSNPFTLDTPDDMLLSAHKKNNKPAPSMGIGALCNYAVLAILPLPSATAMVAKLVNEWKCKDQKDFRGYRDGIVMCNTAIKEDNKEMALSKSVTARVGGKNSRPILVAFAAYLHMVLSV